MNKKTILTASIALLFISISYQPISAEMTSTQNIELQEATIMEKFMDDLERCASESQTFSDFIEKLQNLCLNNEYQNCTIVQEFLSKILPFLIKERGASIGGVNIYDLLGKFSRLRSDYYVISYGAYNRLNPWKKNSIDRFNIGLSMWRYSNTSALLTGRTLVLEQHPFGIHQTMIGPQLGFMKGFKGIHLDIENKLTGNTFMFFVGRVDRIRMFSLSPRST
jgi:hypothetical protein